MALKPYIATKEPIRTLRSGSFARLYFAPVVRLIGYVMLLLSSLFFRCKRNSGIVPKHRKRGKRINYGSALLLCLYVFAITPTILYHHHENEIVPFVKADECEKRIYYGDKESSCNHKAHLVKFFKKCTLCDSHCLSVHTISTCQVFFIANQCYSKYNLYGVSSYQAVQFEKQNRGPPTVLIFMRG